MKYNFNLSWLATDAKVWLWRVVPIGTILAVKVAEQLKGQILLKASLLDLSLLAGWILGWLLAEADHVLYATMCNPQELTCQRVRAEMGKKDWRRAWQLLQETKFERTKLPVRNVLTGFVMTGLGIWVVTSSGSLLAAGLVFGFGIRLFSELLTDTDYKKWYWVFAREFSESEHKGVLMAWAGGLIWQWFTLLRG
jgi:hypothetical protein